MWSPSTVIASLSSLHHPSREERWSSHGQIEKSGLIHVRNVCPVSGTVNIDPGEHDVTTSIGGRGWHHLEVPVDGGSTSVGGGGVYKLKYTCLHSCFPQCCNWRWHFGQNADRLEPVHGPACVAQTLGRWWSTFVFTAAITNYHIFSGLKQYSSIISQSCGSEVQAHIA